MSITENERRTACGWDARHLVDEPEEESSAVDVIANVLHTVPPDRWEDVLRMARQHAEEEVASDE